MTATAFRRVDGKQPVSRLGMPLKEAAEAIGVSYMTLYRATAQGAFPGVKIRGRIIVPIRAVEMLFESASASGELVDAAEWTRSWAAVPEQEAEAS